MRQLILRDGHIHTSFCPHGSEDSLISYVEQAIACGRKEISFTEHFPIPDGIVSFEMQRECNLLERELPAYIKAVKEIKEQYKEKIKINLGFEVDYIQGYEHSIKQLLNTYGQFIEDSLLSTHLVKWEGEYYSIDYLVHFEQLLDKVKSIKIIYDLYFKTLLRSIEADLGIYKPKRIGHPTLVRIFNRKYPFNYKNNELIEQIVLAIKNKEYVIDFNIAGLRKPYCKETYPSGYFLEQVQKYNIPIILGSDAHVAKDINNKDLFN